MKNALDELISGLDTDRKNQWARLLKIKYKEKMNEQQQKRTTEQPTIVGQFQKAYHKCVGKAEEENRRKHKKYVK